MSDSTKPAIDGPEPITRRDFMDGVLLGTGSALLLMQAPGLAGAATKSQSPVSPPSGLDAQWTGPGGVGDYAQANGNTHVTVNAAHALRDGKLDLKDLPAPTEDYDLVIVGGGISGLCSSYEYIKGRGAGSKVLILDNNGIFGGEAKQNDVEVDGFRLTAPQGSNMCIWPASAAEKIGFFWHNAWRELGMPMGDEPWAPTWVDYDKLPAPKNHYSAMMVVRERWPQAQFFRDPHHAGQWKRVMDPWKNGYVDLPWPPEAQKQLAHVDNFVLQAPPGVRDLDRWLDSMTYKEFLTKVVGVTRPEVFKYLDPEIAAYGTGLGCDTVSALAARNFHAPAMSTAEEIERDRRRHAGQGLQFEPVSFPGGNTAVARYFVKRLLPQSIAGGDNMQDILYGAVNWPSLDRTGQPVRIRLKSTVIDVRHEGSVDAATHVLVGYVENATGVKRRVRAKAVIMASGQWVNKYVARDAPAPVLGAMGEFNHAPMLIINVAVRNWRFLTQLGAPAVRWFDDIGWFTNLRAPMSLNGQHMPAEPDKPTILTFYVPYTTFAPPEVAGLPTKAQCVLARTALYNLSYRDIEGRIRQQLSQTLGPYGFDDKRDIAAIITNRWGHAYVAPDPGFYYGKDGKESARDVVRKGYGRVRFGHSELSGEQLWPHACEEGERAAKQILKFT
jgi:spermidine dehydrogenase